MILLNNPGLSPTATAKLLEYQTNVDLKATYPERVEEAKKKFKAYNVKDNITFNEVKDKLTQICCGPERCSYCEDSKADEVEHIVPKSWYPDKCFVWNNYYYSLDHAMDQRIVSTRFLKTVMEHYLNLSENQKILF